MARSARQADAALAATVREDGTTCAGAHAETEAVRAAAATVARLERALAHGAKLPDCLDRKILPSRAGEVVATRRRRLVNDTLPGTVGTNRGGESGEPSKQQ